MSIADKLRIVSDNMQRIYDAGKAEGGGSIELPALTGDLRYAFVCGTWDWFLDVFVNDIKTENITNCEYMFYNYPKDELPHIKLNFAKDKTVAFSSIFNGAKIKSIGNYLSGARPSTLYCLFSSCSYLRTISDDFFNSMVFDDKNISANCHQMCSSCYSLRTVPDLSVFNLIKPTGYSSTIYYYAWNSCYSLDEVVDIPIPNGTFKSNMFNATFRTCKRLKDAIFVTYNGNPIAVEWSNQTIDLSDNVGFTTYSNGRDSYIINYNSGITQDKYVDNAESFEALKDDPDWYGNLEFSRYNIDSAIRTIASLPDVSAGSSNVIKFKGEAGSGSSSDGRKINEMTDAEIAVATAKGWTVTFA